MSMKALSVEEVSSGMGDLPRWTGATSGLERKLEFEDFRGAMQFMQACVEDIDRLNHHPVWRNKYNSVDIHLDTFDVGNVVTELDFKLAHAIERVATNRGHEFGLLAND